MLNIKIRDYMNEYCTHTLVVVNNLSVYKGKTNDVIVIKKIMIFITSKYNYVVCFIGKSNDLDAFTINELQCKLLLYEQYMKAYIVEEHKLKVTFGETLGEKV